MEYLVVNYCFVKKTIALAITILSTIFLVSFNNKNTDKSIFTVNDSIKNDSIVVVQDTVFKLLNSKTITSYYARKFIGKRTASGVKYDANALTCAHKKLKFGTKLKITNLKNNQSIIVTVNDRGPFVKYRTVDLSEKAFLSITKSTNSGILSVKVEQLIEILPKKIIKKDSV
jgi:rare lipoprotein A